MGIDDAPAVDEVARSCGLGVEAAAELRKPWARGWLARIEADVVGFVLAWAVADELHIMDVVTRPDSRRRGVGGALIDALVAYAQAQRLRLVLLEVRRSNRPAIQLYRSRGFHAIGVRRGYYQEDSEDAVEMILALDPETGHIQPGRDEVRLPEMRD